MANRVQFRIGVFVLMAGAGLAAGTNDTVMKDSGSGNAVKDIAEPFSISTRSGWSPTQPRSVGE